MNIQMIKQPLPNSFSIILMPLANQNPGFFRSVLIPISDKGQIPFRFFITQRPGQTREKLLQELDLLFRQTPIASENELMSTIKNFLQEAMFQKRLSYEVR